MHAFLLHHSLHPFKHCSDMFFAALLSLPLKIISHPASNPLWKCVSIDNKPFWTNLHLLDPVLDHRAGCPAFGWLSWLWHWMHLNPSVHHHINTLAILLIVVDVFNSAIFFKIHITNHVRPHLITHSAAIADQSPPQATMRDLRYRLCVKLYLLTDRIFIWNKCNPHFKSLFLHEKGLFWCTLLQRYKWWCWESIVDSQTCYLGYSPSHHQCHLYIFHSSSNMQLIKVWWKIQTKVVKIRIWHSRYTLPCVKS